MKNLLTLILTNTLPRCRASEVRQPLDGHAPSYRPKVIGHAMLSILFKGILGFGLVLLSALSQAQTSQIYYIHTDHLNTPRLLSDSQGRERWRWEQAEGFGSNAPNEQPTATQPKVTFNLRYPGQYFDAETATHYNYFRDYNPQTGRYTTSDPIGLRGGINTYTYVENQPLKKIDPTGLIEHNSGQWKDCGKGCRIRIDTSIINGQVSRHLHWECKNDSGECGEHGKKSHGGSWEDAPNHVRLCALNHGFQGASEESSASSRTWGNIGLGILFIGGSLVAPQITIPAIIIGTAAAK